jgi:glycopeptide antibiotics resistance protein
MKRLVPSIIVLIAYSAVLIKVMVLKDLPMVRIGSIMLNFAGTDAGHGPNFVPFTTIVPYLFGHKGLVIAGINLIGNIILLVPVGFLIPLVFQNISWKASLALAVATSLAIEMMQVALRVGIFDVDDVILNAFGVMLGYWAYLIFAKMMSSPKYRNIAIVAIVIALAVGLYAIFVNPKIRLLPSPTAGTDRSDLLNDSVRGGAETHDLCGGTGGNGQIVSVGNSSFTMERNDGSDQLIKLADQATIETVVGPVSASELKVGNRVTLVGGPNPDGSFTADTVVVCN